MSGDNKGKAEEGNRDKGLRRPEFPCPRLSFSPLAHSRQHAISLLSSARWQPGFTLLELMIVITIVIILAAIVLPQYQKTILATREAVLRDNLFKMRSLIDQFGADKQRLPQTLEELVTEGYIRELPKDPMTGAVDWTVITGDDPNSTKGEQGVVDVHSASPDVSSEGTPYSEW